MVTGHSLQGQTDGACATLLVFAIRASADCIAPACSVNASVARSTLVLDVTDNWKVAFLDVQECVEARWELASQLVGAIVAILFIIAATASFNALVTAEALERVQIHLAGMQVRLVWLALTVSCVLRIHHDLLFFT
jgi:hypothetical protein